MSNYINNSAMDWTPQMALDKARKECDGPTPPDAMVIISLWTTKGNYTTAMLNCGLKRSEVIALLEVAKQRIWDSMRDSVEDEIV